MEKSYGVSKVKKSSDGRKHRATNAKQEALSLMACTYSLMLMTAIEEKKRRYVAMPDAKGALLLADQEDFTRAKFLSKLAQYVKSTKNKKRTIREGK